MAVTESQWWKESGPEDSLPPDEIEQQAGTQGEAAHIISERRWKRDRISLEGALGDLTQANALDVESLDLGDLQLKHVHEATERATVALLQRAADRANNEGDDNTVSMLEDAQVVKEGRRWDPESNPHRHVLNIDVHDEELKDYLAEEMKEAILAYEQERAGKPEQVLREERVALERKAVRAANAYIHPEHATEVLLDDVTKSHDTPSEPGYYAPTFIQQELYVRTKNEKAFAQRCTELGVLDAKGVWKLQHPELGGVVNRIATDLMREIWQHRKETLPPDFARRTAERLIDQDPQLSIRSTE
ncbi:MAG: hypothetical protein ABIG71_02650 [Candidatus Uhrbacteria bacterium]